LQIFIFGIWGIAVKGPPDLASRLVTDSDSRFCRMNFKLPLEEARLRARREFRFFPAEAYLTEIESWRELRNGFVEFSVKRLRDRNSDTSE
jgi:hypothetical protein